MQKVRIPHFSHSSLDWEVDHALVIRRPQVHVYIMTKSEDAAQHYVPTCTDIVDRTMADDRVVADFDASVHVSHILKDASHTGFVKLTKIRDADDLLRGYQEGKIRIMGSGKIVPE